MTDRNIIHKVICGCDANQACPEWDTCLNAELAVRTQWETERASLYRQAKKHPCHRFGCENEGTLFHRGHLFCLEDHRDVVAAESVNADD